MDTKGIKDTITIPVGEDEKGKKYIIVPPTTLSKIDTPTRKILDELDARSLFHADKSNIQAKLAYAFQRHEYQAETNPATLTGLEYLLPYDELLEALRETGSGIPYYTSMIGDVLINPSTVNIQTFKKMMETDDVIFQALDYNISSIVNSIGLYLHENKEIEDLVRYTFQTLPRGFDDLIKEMCMAFSLGFSVHTLHWDYDEDVKATIIKDVIALPQSTIQFRVDGQGYIKEDGIGQYVYNSYLQNIANAASLGYLNGLNTDPTTAPYLINQTAQYNYPYAGIDQTASDGDMDFPFRIPWYSPVGLLWLKRANTMVYSYFGVSRQMNPYGRSMLRPLYNLWLQTTALQQFKMVALNRRSFPLLFVYCNQTTPIADIDPTNPEASIQSAMNAQQAASKYLEDVNSLSTVILPGMKDEVFHVEPVQVDGNMDFFAKLEQDLNDRKKSLLGVPVTLTAGGDSGSYALAYLHGQSNSRVVAAGRKDILNTLLLNFVRPLIIENFRKEEYTQKDGKNWGYFEDEQISTDERLKNANLYQIAIESNLAFPTYLEDLNKMREGLGLSQINSKDKLQQLLKELQQLNPPEKSQDKNYDKRDRNDLQGEAYTHNKDAQT